MDIRTTLTAAALTTAAWAGLSQTEQELFSGPIAGEPIVPFDVVAATGEERDTVVDYVTRYDGAPTVYCFIHNVTRASSRAIRALDEACVAREADGLEALFVMLGADQDETERYGLRLPTILSLTSDVGISVDGLEGPGAWGLDREMVLSITVAKGDVAVASFPLMSPNETDVPRVMEAVDAALVGLETFDDLRDEVLALRRDVRALQGQMASLLPVAPAAGERGGGMRGGAMRDGMQAAGGVEGTTPTVEQLLRSVLEPGIDAATAAQRVGSLRRLTQSDPEQARRLLELGQGTSGSDAGTPAARRALEALMRDLSTPDDSMGGGR